ncbi:hypothetical protein AGABI2DRAFT_194638 [Agaricus bisporus var. bisporus H97]|uniref:hypothetical protein n=1 Tax=Agaricus bisporus var. bisporus (strain H97 / ATCC MYA-4626 / FGSC 10389) TaxID=936046 RepID=UPI00029F53B9|nr:hypothetical protein AGABI2DRAFT_194638 [Agaricus bisporus var. bisporus H97]EKV44714.1 hypothetical protein AGABI2DRAFT_194638 [Agaricus bisporus var. bisporus H97]
MCFPSKRQKNNFADKSTDPKSVSDTNTKGEAKATEPVQAPEPIQAPEPTSSDPVSTFTLHSSTTMPRVAIVIYSMYGHIATMAEAVKAGIVKAGGKVDIYQVPETLSNEILVKMKAPAKPSYPVIQPEGLTEYDAFLFGIPTRYGTMPAQWKAFWDATGGLWAAGKLAGKYAGIFVSTGTQNGGQETTALTTLTTLTHHGIIFVPFGYSHAFAEFSSFETVRGGSPWGAGTYAGHDGSRSPVPLELTIAEKHGKSFWEIVSKVNF